MVINGLMVRINDKKGGRPRSLGHTRPYGMRMVSPGRFPSPGQPGNNPPAARAAGMVDVIGRETDWTTDRGGQGSRGDGSLLSVRLVDKSWLEALLINLLWEKNIVRWLKKYGL